MWHTLRIQYRSQHTSNDVGYPTSATSGEVIFPEHSEECDNLHIVVDSSHTLHIVSTKNIFSAYGELFKVGDIDIQERLPLHFSLPLGTDIPFSYDIDLADLINNKYFGGYTIRLTKYR